MTPAEFTAKWAKSSGKESAGDQEHFHDLCRMLGDGDGLGEASRVEPPPTHAANNGPRREACSIAKITSLSSPHPP